MAAVGRIVPGLARALGDDAEVVLHEFSHPQDSVVAIAGNITGRQVGAPLTDLVLRLLRQGKTDEDRISYPSRSSDGKLLKSSTIFIRDENNAVIGCLCINFDLTRWAVAQHAVEEHCRTQALEDGERETFTHDVESILDVSVEEALRQVGIPVVMMKKEDKLKVVKALDERGVFMIKGAVDSVAKYLEVSRYTIYNYLDEARGQKSAVLALNRRGGTYG